ncbi:sulfite exporter TauE/SafE family protein [Chromatiaceae bacterium AAb-1]|nr:sulfite exporter TauE/SafE family protein [Chromatiaceae bacterium AAb-1]
MLVVLFSAIVIGICLGLFGSGGSILTVPVLLYLLNFPPQQAIASSLLIVALISLCISIPNLRQQLISWRHVIWFGIPGMLGTYGGAWVGTLADSRWQLLSFSLLMLTAAIMMWQAKTTANPAIPAASKLRITADGLVVGLLTGFVGVGGGFLIVPALVLLGGLSLQAGIATSLIIITLKSLSGFAGYYNAMSANLSSFNWPVIATMVLAGVAGSYVGCRLGQKLPRQKLQRSFAIFLVIMALIVISQSVI